MISTGLSEAIEQVKAGKVRVIAVSSPQALPGDLAKVPTWRSLGIDVSILHWRGLFAPPGIPADAVKYWDGTLGKDSAAAAFYEIWVRKIRPAFAERQVPAEARELVLKNLTLERTVALLKELPAAERQAVLAQSLEAAVAEAKKVLGEDTARWRWGPGWCAGACDPSPA